MSTKILFFSQLPIGSKFRFQWPTEGKVFVKSSEEGAHHDGAFQPVREPNIVVFPVQKIVSVAFILSEGSSHVADYVEGKWHVDADYDQPGIQFNNLDEIIAHLEGN